MNFGIKHIYIIWMLVGRFIMEGEKPQIMLDTFYVLLSLLVFRVYRPTNILAIVSLISIYTLYNDLLNTFSISTHNGIVSALGTLITFYISFNPSTLWKKL